MTNKYETADPKTVEDPGEIKKHYTPWKSHEKLQNNWVHF